jgi:hypothetical protein
VSDVRPWWACNANPCTCPKPLPNLVSVAKGAEYVDRIWLEWLVSIGYGVDFTHNPPPPCEPSALAEVYAETDGESVEDWTAILLNGNTAGGWYGNGSDEP